MKGLCIELRELMEAFFPIIHIIGLPGAGKTTLGKRLSKKLDLPLHQIGEYRSKFPSTPIGEADAWVALFRDLSRRKWKDCILETTGLNCRESFLKAAFPMFGRVTIKLETQRKVLFARIAKKKKVEQGGEWLFSKDYHDKYEFVRKLFKAFKLIPAEITINTSNLDKDAVYKIALEKLRLYVIPWRSKATTKLTTPLSPIRVKLSVSWGGMDKLCLSVPRDQQLYESCRRCGRSLSPAGGGKGGGLAQVRILAYLQPEYLCVCLDNSTLCNEW